MTEIDVGFVEGGEFICYEHNIKCTNQEEWNNHRIGNHKEKGVTLCNYCGLPTVGTFDIMPDLKLKAICEVCGPKRNLEPNGVRK